MSYIGTNKLGTMYLGDTKIAKAYLGSDLVYEVVSSAPEPYIETGLVFWLDCADATTGSWTDKISDKAFTLYNVTKDSKGGVVFNGSNAYGKSTSNIYYNKATCTIEVVVSNVSNKEGGVFCNTQGGLSFWYTAASTVINGATKSSGASKWIIPITGTHVASLANTVGYQDGSLLTNAGTVSAYGGSETGTYIGMRDINTNNGSKRSLLKGTIYQVRIYNRLLTAEEIAYNQGIDIRKYNITT